jgi:poly(hydroxyalkanoate) granule-associated protein
MSEQEIEIVESNTSESGNTLLEGLRRVLMAGIGVAVLAQEEIEDFVTKLVDRGEIAENDGRSLISDVLERRRKEIQEGTKNSVDRSVESMLGRMNVPTKSEINSLSEQISELSKKVDQLRELDE